MKERNRFMRKWLMVVVLVISVTFVRCTTFGTGFRATVRGGTNWEYLGATTDKVHVFYDPKTITHSNSIIKFQVRIVNELEYESFGWQEVDCARNEFRGFSFTVYDKYYRLVDSQAPDTPWTSIPPKSVAEKLKKKYCR